MGDEKHKMKELFSLFWVFFKIGTFSIGGGYAMIPLIEKEAVDKRKWITKEDFVDMLALSQSAPGPIAVDCAAYVGYKVAGIAGSIFAAAGAIITSYLILLFVAIYYVGVKDNVVIKSIFKGLKPAVVALIAAPIIGIAKTSKVNRKNIFIPVIAAILVAFFNVNAIYVICISAALGLVHGYIVRRKNI